MQTQEEQANLIQKGMDGILIFSQTEEELVGHICRGLQRLLQHQLSVKSDKLVFHQNTVSFLGFISSRQIEMYPEKVNVVLNWSVLTGHKQLQRSRLQCLANHLPRNMLSPP